MADNISGLVAGRPWLAILMLALMLAEYLRRRADYDVRGAAASFGVALGQALLRPVNLSLQTLVLGSIAALAPIRLPIDDWRTWVAGFLVVDFVYYWFHRASHQVRWLWATHAVHHSATQMTLPAAIRLGWTGSLSMGWLIFAPVLLAGFPPTVLAAMLALNLLYQFPLHTEAIGRLGALEWLFNTPSHHRAHHSRDEAYLDCNFGGVLILWDRMFGTFRPEPADMALHYGLVHHEETANPVRIALGEWGRLLRAMASAGSPGAAIRLALGPPD